MQVSSSQVSLLTSTLDDELEQWRNRPLPAISHLIFDATYLKVRIDSCVRDTAVLLLLVFAGQRARGWFLALLLS